MKFLKGSNKEIEMTPWIVFSIVLVALYIAVTKNTLKKVKKMHELTDRIEKLKQKQKQYEQRS